MPLQPAIRDAGEEYAGVTDLLYAEDRPTKDVRVPWWTKDGRAVLLRVQGPNLEDQEKINRRAQIAAVRQARKDALELGPDIAWEALMPADGREWLTFCVETLRACVVAPRLSDAEARGFTKKNPHAVEDLVAFCWALSDLDDVAIATHVHAAIGGAGRSTR